LTISSLGGDEEAPAEVKLGRGGDWLTLGFMPDASRHFIDGQQGDDRIAISGATVDLADAIANFETLSLVEASGLYDVEGVGLDTIELGSIIDDISFAGLAAGASINISETTSRSLTVEIVGADAGTSDALELRMHLGADLGASEAGFSAENLSRLTVEVTSDGAVLHLTELGAADDAVTLEITGGHHLTLKGTDGMATYIANLSVIDGSIDLSSLAGYSDAFLSTGATISGGAKADVLVGGDGADTITTGDGNNTVLGSLGADEITLGAGADTLVFTAQAQSSNDAARDTIEGFDTDEDVIDLAALANPVEFQGTVASLAAGEATLSTSWAGAFFNSADSALYIDIDRDMDIDTSDMRIVLTGVGSLTSWNIDG
jgi:Ca2+-binding RTX toxin-like protein